MRPAIPDNDIHWKVLENDEHIAMLIQQSGKFANQLQPKIAEAYDDQVIQLKSNKLPKGLITLGSLFDCEDMRNDKIKFTMDKGDYTKLKIGERWKIKMGKNVP